MNQTGGLPIPHVPLGPQAALSGNEMSAFAPVYGLYGLCFSSVKMFRGPGTRGTDSRLHDSDKIPDKPLLFQLHGILSVVSQGLRQIITIVANTCQRA